MANTIELDSVLDDLQNANDDIGIWDGLTRFLSVRDIEAYIYHHLPAPGAIDYKEGYSFKKSFDAAQEGRCKSMEVRFQRDLRATARSMIAPKFWDDQTFLPPVVKTPEKPEAGVSLESPMKGVSIPVHGPYGRNGCFSLAFSDMDRRYETMEIQSLRWACQNAHQNFCRLLAKQSSALPKLTVREKEILTWIALGKSNVDISEILGLSIHTVGTYIRRIFIKTNTTNRTSAALFGVSNGLINL